MVVTLQWLPKRLRNLHETFLDLRRLVLLWRVFSFVADNVPIVWNERRKSPSSSQVWLIKDWHHIVAVLGLQMSVQVLLLIGGVDKAVKTITVVSVVVEEHDLNLVLLAIFEEFRVKPYAVAVKDSFV